MSVRPATKAARAGAAALTPARAVYTAVTWAVQPLLRRKLARRAVAEPGYAEAIGERFGRYARTGSAAASGPVWVHAVSLGETRAASILLKALRERLPGMRLLLTHSTATGRAEGARLLQPGDEQVWLPWDTPGAVRRFLHRFRPQVGVLMETEVWPNLVAGCQRQGVPLVLANARLNDRSLRKARRLGALARPAYGGLTAVWAQTEADAQRLRALGAPVQAVLGNLKFDVEPDPAQQALGLRWRTGGTHPVVMLASSREGEEALWLQAWQAHPATVSDRDLDENWPLSQYPSAQGATNLGAKIPSLGVLPTASTPAPGRVQWLIVPRHPQRFGEVEQLLRSAGLTVSRRSQWVSGPPRPGEVDVWLGDSVGEMAAYYTLADVALLGGSFAPLGGQNLIEAAACGCPVMLGPHTFNFAEAAEMACAEGIALRVSDMAQGIAAACDLVADVHRHTAVRAQALRYLERHRGAAQATADAVVHLLSAP